MISGMVAEVKEGVRMVIDGQMGAKGYIGNVADERITDEK